MIQKITNYLSTTITILCFIFPAINGWCYQIPIETGDTSTTHPLCVVYTHIAPPEHTPVIHAMLYDDGRLYWTEGYRDLKFPPDTSSSSEGKISYPTNFISLSDEEINAFKNTINSRKTVEQYGYQEFKANIHFSIEKIMYFENNQYFTMITSHNTDIDALIGTVWAEQHPELNLTPTPIPTIAQPFFDDWNFVSNALFTLVDEHQEDSVLLGTLTFESWRVMD